MSVLALRALGIGDLATAVPALRALRAGFPATPLTLAAPARLAPLAELTGAVDRLVPLDGLAAPVPDLPPPAVAVNLHGRGPRSHRLLGALHPELLLAFSCPEAGYPDGPQWMDREHETLRWCRLLDWYGIPAYPGDLTLHVPASPARVPGATVVHPGAGSVRRRWPAGRFASVARNLSERGQHVVVTGSAAEAGLALDVATRAGLPADRVLAGQLDLTGLAALVAASRLVVSADTGVAHLATGYGVPSVVLFGPVPPDRWGPPADRPQHRALWPGPRPGAPGGPDPALLAIQVDQVLAAADRLAYAGLQRSTTPSARRPPT